MSLIVADGGGAFENCPEGFGKAVCVDVVDLGQLETQWGKKHKVRIAWESEQKMEDGKPYIVTNMYTASLDSRAELRKMVESWRGSKFSDEELKGWDLEKLIGQPCQLQIVHNTKNDKTYANVTSVVPLSKGMDPLAPSGHYVRVKDRDMKDQGGKHAPDDDRPKF